VIKIKRLYEEGKDLFAVSDESPFYPDGKGGQLGDRGTIGPAKVLYVKEVNGEVHHKIDKPIEPGEYDFEIDQARRKDIATQHTAQHILSAAFLKVVQAQTVSFHMGEKTSTIDIDLPVLTERTIEDVERLANEIVKSCVNVEILFVEREEAEKMNLRKYPQREGWTNSQSCEGSGFRSVGVWRFPRGKHRRDWDHQDR